MSLKWLKPLCSEIPDEDCFVTKSSYQTVIFMWVNLAVSMGAEDHDLDGDGYTILVLDDVRACDFPPSCYTVWHSKKL